MHKMPPLSFVDKTIYWFLFLLLCGAYIVLLFGPLYLRHRIAFADRSVAAVEDNISIFWLGVPWMTFFLMTFIPWMQAYQDRKPIFGKRNFKYGPPAWPKVYPLFMKNKPYVFESERKKKERKQIAIVLLVVLLISFIPLPWSLYGRDCLRHDGSIVQYNMFNKEVRNFSSEEITNVKIETYRYSTGKGGIIKKIGEYGWYLPQAPEGNTPLSSVNSVMISKVIPSSGWKQWQILSSAMTLM